MERLEVLTELRLTPSGSLLQVGLLILLAYNFLRRLCLHAVRLERTKYLFA